MGLIMNSKFIDGEARDIETIIRLRKWIEDEWSKKYGSFKKSHLRTDYNAKTNIFKFRIFFERQS